MHSSPLSLYLDFHGKKMWNAFPSYVKGMSGLVLPMNVPTYNWRVQHQKKAKDKLLFSATLGGGVSHATLKDCLKKLEAAGDPEFVMEMRDSLEFEGGGSIALFKLKASQINSSLESGEPFSVDSNEDDDSAAMLLSVGGRRNGATPWRFAYWLKLPILFTAAMHTLWWRPELFANAPHLFRRFSESLLDVLPIHPTTLSSSFALGALWGKIEDALKLPQHAAAVADLLTECSKLVGRAVTVDEMREVHTTLVTLEQNQGVVSRTLGFFSFVNFVWLISILGITVSVGPVVWHILTPLRMIFVRFLTLTWENIIKPTIIMLHNTGGFELASYVLALWVVVDGWRLGTEHDTAGMFISLSGVALALGPCFAYSVLLHGLECLKIMKDDTKMQLFNIWVALSLFPLAVHRDSTLVGYLCVISLYAAVGFSVACYGMCYCIGFNSEDALHRSAVVSALSLVGGAALEIFGQHNGVARTTFAPFRSASFVMGGIVYYLAMLIISCQVYTRPQDSNRYYRFQGMTVASLLAGLFVGNVFGIPGLANTATVFTAFYITEKYVELHTNMDWNGWFLMLGLSGLAYKGSMYCHQNPSFISAIFA